MVEEPTPEKEGLRIRVCRNDAGHVEKELIPALKGREKEEEADTAEADDDVEMVEPAA